MSNTAGSTCYPRIRVARSLVVCAMFYRSLVEPLDIALHVQAIDYPFGIFIYLLSDWNDQIHSYKSLG